VFVAENLSQRLKIAGIPRAIIGVVLKDKKNKPVRLHGLYSYQFAPTYKSCRAHSRSLVRACGQDCGKTQIMKNTSSILIALAVAGLVSSAGASYIVTVGPGFQLIVNQYDQGQSPNTLNDVLPPGSGVTAGMQLFKFDNNIQAYLPRSTFKGLFWDPNYCWNPGEGVFLFVPAANGTANLTMSGNQPNPLCFGSLANGSFVGSRCDAAPASFADVFNLAPADGTEFYKFCRTLQSFCVSSLYDAGAGTWSSGPPSLGVGEAGIFIAPGGPGFALFTPPPLVGVGFQVDLYSVTPYPLRTPCCGHPMTYIAFYWNDTANTVAAGSTLTVNLPSLVTTRTTFGLLDYYAAPPVPLVPAVNTTTPLTWILPQLLPYSYGVVSVTVDVSGPGCTLPTDLVTLNASATLTPPSGTAATAAYSQNTTCSYDPNDKAVTPHGCGPDGLIAPTTSLTYVVQFQNLGNGPASQVVIRDRFHPNLDLGTFQMLGNSHPFSLSVNGRELVWTFAGINLPPASSNEPGSHGYVKFRAKPIPNLDDGSVITNQAAIYFDLNPPVLTTTTTNTITSDPFPVASFRVSRTNLLVGASLTFTYTGGTPGATFLWDFGPGAVPATSVAQNPSGVSYTTPGPKFPRLIVTLGDCHTEPAVLLLNVGSSVPRLNIQPAGDQAVLWWTDAAFRLQASPLLGPAAVWTNIPGASAVSTPTGPGSLFFRLTNR